MLQTGAHLLLLLALGLLLLMQAPAGCRGSNILVVPLDGSHWVNMAVILRELHSRGHRMTVVRSAKSWYIPERSPYYTSLQGHSLEDETEPGFYLDMLQRVMEHRRWPATLRSIRQQMEITATLSLGHGICARAVAAMLDDPVLMGKLRDGRYDLMLTDPGLPIGFMLGAYLGLPMVFSARWANTGDSHFTVTPSPASYVPVTGTELHPEMDFLERSRNLLHYLYSNYEQHVFINPAYSEVLERHFPPGANLLSMQHLADIWMMRVDFVFEFPRPTMPNVVYIGGFQCREARPLPPVLEAFMQSSGEHGVVVMSLGTLVAGLPKETTEAIAGAFSQLPHKVVWRYVGQRPSNLANNTLLLDWLPQNDLLGHPKTRALVSHGGTNGLYEALYHGVPVLGLPLLFDQFDNLVRLERRGVARVAEASALSAQDFLEALRDVLENPSYRDNMKRLSELHHDKPLAPLDTAVFWVEYVIRNRGAAHLRSAGSTLPWFSYHGLDVALFLVALSTSVLWLLVCVCRRLCQCTCRTKYKVE